MILIVKSYRLCTGALSRNGRNTEKISENTAMSLNGSTKENIMIMCD